MNVFDSTGRIVGSIEPEHGRVAAYSADGRRLGSFETAIEAASAVFRNARLGASERERILEEELIAGVERYMKGS